MSNRGIIEAVAKFWIILGGDKEGFERCYHMIAEEIGRRSKGNKQEDGV